MAELPIAEEAMSLQVEQSNDLRAMDATTWMQLSSSAQGGPAGEGTK